MAERRIVRVRESLLEENRVEASALRERLREIGVALVNVMSSPGSGKTSLILRTLEALRGRFGVAVIEADIDSTVDSDKVEAVGVPAVQIETGGFCHVDASMVSEALSRLPRVGIDLVFLENVGNLICTAQHDTGAQLDVAILSVPEGDDKPLKYPVMFQAADVVLINKTDYMAIADFDIDAVRERIAVLNPDVPVLPVSCRTGEGVAAWVNLLEERLATR